MEPVISAPDIQVALCPERHSHLQARFEDNISEGASREGRQAREAVPKEMGFSMSGRPGLKKEMCAISDKGLLTSV